MVGITRSKVIFGGILTTCITATEPLGWLEIADSTSLTSLEPTSYQLWAPQHGSLVQNLPISHGPGPSLHRGLQLRWHSDAAHPPDRATPSNSAWTLWHRPGPTGGRHGQVAKLWSLNFWGRVKIEKPHFPIRVVILIYIIVLNCVFCVIFRACRYTMV